MLNNVLNGRVALVTGGSSGIGRECVKALAKCGAKVAFTYNTGADRAEELSATRPDSLSAHLLNLRNSESIERVVDEVRQRWGGLHILVNNAAAGSATIRHYEPDPAKQDAALMEINSVGALAVCNAGIRAMKENTDDVSCGHDKKTCGGNDEWPHSHKLCLSWSNGDKHAEGKYA